MALRQGVAGEALRWEEEHLAHYSRDFHYLSPVLSRELAGKRADCIAVPRDESELDAIVRIACEFAVPLTPRGAGTSNYGQSVPLDGGIVLDFTQMNRILEIGKGYMRVQAGANMKKMELAARESGQELVLLPTTYKKSTVGGFVCGGFGGIGAVTWGTIWDGLVKGMMIRTVEPEPRSYWVEDEQVAPYLHSYGTVGLVTELCVSLVPRIAWKQWVVSFARWETAARFGLDIAEHVAIKKRLVSIDEWPIPSYFTPLKLPADQSVVLLEIAEESEAAFLETVKRWEGQVQLEIPADAYMKGLCVSDFSFGHSRLWVQRHDPSYTNLQLSMNVENYEEVLQELKRLFPDLLIQLELIRMQHKVVVTARPIYKYISDERIASLIAQCEAMGMKADNSHTYDLQAGGRAFALETLLALKRSNDPLGLLNPQKLKVS